MPSLLVAIFVVEVVVNVINAIGATAINNLVLSRLCLDMRSANFLQLWTLINFLPVPTSKAAGEQRKLQADYLKVRRDLNATSSQDEFARWAKLRRQHDKLLEQLENKSTWEY